MTNPRLKVLLIEDNPADARLLRETFSELAETSFDLVCAERLSQGIEILKSEAVGLILLDLSLPDSRGLETFRRTYAAAPALPVVILSGLADEALALETLQEGAQDYLVKGHVDAYLLSRAVRYAIERKRVQEQLARHVEELRERNERMEQELRMARELQLAMLPQQFPTVPGHVVAEDSAIRFFSFYRPSGTVSGDFFDVARFSDSAVGVFICDVMGHDVRAALVTAMLRAQMAELGSIAREDPEAVLTAMNDNLVRLFRHAETTMFATAFYLTVDVDRGRLRYVNAGHPTPIHLRRQVHTIEPLGADDSRGPALGLFEDAHYRASERLIAAQDLILLFTDGLFEAENPNEEAFSRDRLVRAVRQRTELPAERFCSELVGEVQRFSRRTQFADDVCLVTMEVARLGGAS